MAYTPHAVTTTIRPSSTKSPPANVAYSSQSVGDSLRKAVAWLRITPNWLMASIVGAALVSTIFASSVHNAAAQRRATTYTIRKEAAPSIVAGQEMLAALADMHGELANELLVDTSNQQAIQDAHKGFEARLDEAAVNIRKAAQNITYGSAEEEPVDKILKCLPKYMELAGRARLLHDLENKEYIRLHQKADKILHEDLMPAANRLIEVNQTELNRAFSAAESLAAFELLLVFLSSWFLVGGIVGLSYLLFKRMRRVVNPPLAAAAIIAVVCCLWALLGLWESSIQIKVAKKDAFDSISVLEKARALAYDANGDESRWLLCKGNTQQIDGGSAADYEQAFRTKVARVAHGGNSWQAAYYHQDVPTGMTGLLADELNNITFPKELESARETLAFFNEYLTIDAQIRELENQGKHDKALELCVGKGTGQSNWAFDNFDKALGRTIEINQDAFRSSLKSADSWLAGLDNVMPFGLVAVVTGLTIFGLLPRLKEYRSV